MNLRLSKKIIILLLTLFPFFGSTQMFDSIQKSLQHTPKFYGNYGTRNSFINNSFAKVQDVKLGVTYNKQFTLALGYSWLNSNFESTLRDETKVKLKMRYITPFAEYSFLEHKNIEVTIPVHLGFGVSFYQDENKKQHKKHFIMVYEPAMTITYRLLKYFGVGAGIGYRLMLVGNRYMNEEFNSPIYLLKTKIFFGDIYKDLFKK